MRRLLLLFMLLLFGCGSGGGSNPIFIASPFAGSWYGPWVDSGNAQSGTLTVTISSAGASTGSVYNATVNQTGSISGSIAYSGVANFTYTYPSDIYTAHCTLAIDSNGHLSGNCNEYYQGSLIGTCTVDLTKQ